jgi:hypothetical protein
MLGLGFMVYNGLMGLSDVWAELGASRPTSSTKSMTSRLIYSSCWQVDLLAREVESSSQVGLP